MFLHLDLVRFPIAARKFTPRCRRGSTLLLLLLCATMARAGNYNVAPVRLEIENGQRAGTVEVTSSDPRPILLRAEVQRWTMEAGKDVFSPSAALVAVPPVFRLEPLGHQVVRVGFLGKPAPVAEEQAYKLIFTEVPETDADAERGGADTGVRIELKTTLRLDMPVYVLPRKGKLELGLKLKSMGEHGADLELENLGNLHLKLSEVRLEGSDGKSIAFPQPYLMLMPAASRIVPVPGQLASLSPPFVLHYRQNAAEKQSPLKLE